MQHSLVSRRIFSSFGDRSNVPGPRAGSCFPPFNYRVGSIARRRPSSLTIRLFEQAFSISILSTHYSRGQSGCCSSFKLLSLPSSSSCQQQQQQIRFRSFGIRSNKRRAPAAPEKKRNSFFGLLLLLLLLLCEVASASRAIREQDGSDVRDPGLPALIFRCLAGQVHFTTLLLRDKNANFFLLPMG